MELAFLIAQYLADEREEQLQRESGLPPEAFIDDYAGANMFASSSTSSVSGSITGVGAGGASMFASASSPYRTGVYGAGDGSRSLQTVGGGAAGAGPAPNGGHHHPLPPQAAGNGSSPHNGGTLAGAATPTRALTPPLSSGNIAALTEGQLPQGPTLTPRAAASMAAARAAAAGNGGGSGSTGGGSGGISGPAH
jgi:hypothetical protein